MTKLTRAEQVLENDRRIQEALLDLIAELGWDQVTIAAIARRADVTVGAVYARAENLAELANSLWLTSLEFTVRDFVDAFVADAANGDATAFLERSASVDRDHRDLMVALELIVASLFDDELAEVISLSFANILRAHVQAETGSIDQAHRSAALFLVLSFMFGRLLAYQSGDDLEAITPGEARVLCGYVNADPVQTEVTSAPEIAFTLDFEGDATIQRAVTEVVGRWGYRKATLARIARTAGVRPGALFSRYSSKADLIAEATIGVVASPIQIWKQYDQVMENEGSPRARTLFLSRYLDPEHIADWKLRLELARISHKVSGLEEFHTPADPLQRTHLGVLLLGCFIPGSAGLPFEGSFRSGVAV